MGSAAQEEIGMSIGFKNFELNFTVHRENKNVSLSKKKFPNVNINLLNGPKGISTLPIEYQLFKQKRNEY